MAETPLKIAVTDADDISVLSTLLQDAVIPITEMAWISEQSRFAFVANRFRWEDAGEDRVAGRIYERVRCGVTFDRVTSVQRQYIDPARRSQVLELLAIEAGDGYVDLLFAGGGTIRLSTDRILCHAEDFGEPWPTQWRPEHESEDRPS